MKQLIVKQDIANDNHLKAFEYKTKLLRNTAADPNPNHAYEILRNATILCH